MLNNAFVTPEEPRRVGLYVFANRDAPETHEHLLPLFRKKEIDEELCGVWMRRLGRQHQGIDLYRHRLQRDPIHRMTLRSLSLNRRRIGNDERYSPAIASCTRLVFPIVTIGSCS